MQPAILWLLAGILGLLSAVHFYWALGGRLGIQAAIPSTVDGKAVFTPPARSAYLMIGFSLAVGAVGVLAVYDPWLKAQSLRAMAVVFVLRAVGEFRYAGFTKRVQNSEFAFWDTYLYSPLCVLMALLALAASIY